MSTNVMVKNLSLEKEEGTEFSHGQRQAKEPTAHEQMRVSAGFNYIGMHTANKAKTEELDGLTIWP